MREITDQSWHSFCRTCLQELGEKSSLLGEKYKLHESEELEKLVIAHSSMSLAEDVELPEFVCDVCYEKLQSFYEFSCKIKQSICILSHILLKDSNINEAFKENNMLDSGQGNEEHQETSDNGGLKAGTYSSSHPTKNRDQLQNIIENTVVEDLKDPLDSYKDMKNAYNEEIYEIGIGLQSNITGIKSNTKYFATITPESSKHEDALDDLEISRDCQNFGDRLSSLDIYTQTPALQEKEGATGCDRLIDEPRNKSPGASVKEKGGKYSFLKNKISPHKEMKKSAKAVKIVSRKNATKHSQSDISGVAKFQCEQCPRRSVSWENYEAHLRTHQGLKPYLCNECGHSFNRAAHFRAHVREVHAPVTLQFICSFEGCSKVFKREGSYKMHYRLKHSPAYVNREPKKYICEDCGGTFKNGTKFKEHRYKHAPVEEYPFKCNECGKRYRSKRTYKEHQMRHSGIKNFVCPHCGMRKTTQNELRSHINYHTKEKQWSCSKCPSVFNSSANLGMHDRIVHKGIRRFACSYCNQSFGKQDTLKHHEMRHTGEKPHGCELCGKRFIQVVALRAHLKTHNKQISRKSIKIPEREKPETLAQSDLRSEAESIVAKID